MSSWHDDTDEIVVLYRNKNTGEQSYLLLSGVVEHELEESRVYTDPEEIPFLGGLAWYKPNAELVSVSLTIKATGTGYGYARSLSETPLEQMRKSTNGH